MIGMKVNIILHGCQMNRCQIRHVLLYMLKMERILKTCKVGKYLSNLQFTEQILQKIKKLKTVESQYIYGVLFLSYSQWLKRERGLLKRKVNVNIWLIWLNTIWMRPCQHCKKPLLWVEQSSPKFQEIISTDRNDRISKWFYISENLSLYQKQVVYTCIFFEIFAFIWCRKKVEIKEKCNEKKCSI